MKRFLALSAFCTLCACQTDETISGFTQDGSVWSLKSINGLDFTSTATITFPAKGQIAGAGPCNQYAANQNAPYPWIEISQLSATKRGCADLQQEVQYFTALQGVTLAEVSGGTLLLSNDAGDELLFTLDQADD